ncbi:MAG TPA: hypothetical protein VMU53_00605 [Candidatus Sulfotelmatobacter sp.]|nr:hypothetical protein [Candidatus Sulfotelmatobacter sp.]
MKNYRMLVAACAVLLVFLCALQSVAGDAPNVAGTWNISVTGDAGSAQQTVVLKQDGSKITGTFKGPRQSGRLEGSIDGNQISFHVSTHVPLDYKGTVDGETMKGTMTGKGKTGSWTATRSK